MINLDTIVLKFGGSSVADNAKLDIVAKKIIDIKQKTKNVVVVVSAQGKTTDRLIKEAQELSNNANGREMDMLLSTGEQCTASKLSIVLNEKGYPAISLAGWQAGIQTNNIFQNAKIETIYPKRIIEELNLGKIVIVAGFQGVNEKQDITTLGRGGSDTTAVAIGAALNAESCYIFSDVAGIYSADPNAIKTAKKLENISFDEMQDISEAGAKVLHSRCIQIGKKFDCDIYAKSTFSDDEGTKICKKIENSEIKSIVKNDKLSLIKIKGRNQNIYNELLENNIIFENYKICDETQFIIQESEKEKAIKILEKKLKNNEISQEKITKLTVVGYCIIQDNTILKKIIKILEENLIKIFEMNLMQSKIEMILEDIDNDVLEKLHKELFYREAE